MNTAMQGAKNVLDNMMSGNGNQNNKNPYSEVFDERSRP
jgi:hypothetical protein